MKEQGIPAQQEFWFEVLRPGDTGPLWRQALEIVFILEGSGKLEMEGAEASYAIGKGDLFAINAFQMRGIELDAGAVALSLMIDPSFITALSPETIRPNVDCRSFLYEEEGQKLFDLLRQDVARTFKAQYKKEVSLSIHMRGRVAVLLDDLFRYFLLPVQNTAVESGRERLRAAVEYIHVHYRENITLTELAECTFLSPAYLSRSFAKHLGMPFTAYLAQVRLKKAAALLGTDETVTDIAYQTGFSSANAFIEVFKLSYGMTPGQYRRNLQHTKEDAASKERVTEDGFSTVFASLMQYAENADAETGEQPYPATISEITVNTENARKTLQHNWKRMINAGYARDLLNEGLQKQILRLQKEIGYEYIRCKGILDDDMMLYTKDLFGKVTLNCVYLDEVIDFILGCGARPMLEFGHIPSVLAAHHRQTFRRAALIAPAADRAEWKKLVGAVMNHLGQRYGIKELEHWLFSCWITPELSAFGLFTLEEYAQMYTASYEAIRETGGNLRICGPGANMASREVLKWYLDMCFEKDCLPDILSMRAFAAVEPETEEGALKLVENNEAFHLAVSGDESYLFNNWKQVRELLDNRHLEWMPVMLDEWNNNIWQRDLCNDTCYKSAYLFKSVLENCDRFFGMGYFSTGDQLDEIAPVAELFCGGFGLFLRNGMPKSAYRALTLLAKAGNRLISKGEGYFIAADDREIQIFLYHYSHYDMLYRYRHTTNLTQTDRYKVFNEIPPRVCHINLEGLAPGKHVVKHYSISPKGGSTFDEWVAMGAPGTPDREEEEFLDCHSMPLYYREEVEAGQRLCLKAALVPHEVQLITICK